VSANSPLTSTLSEPVAQAVQGGGLCSACGLHRARDGQACASEIGRVRLRVLFFCQTISCVANHKLHVSPAAVAALPCSLTHSTERQTLVRDLQIWSPWYPPQHRTTRTTCLRMTALFRRCVPAGVQHSTAYCAGNNPLVDACSAPTAGPVSLGMQYIK
jgi:hypothetical protein